MSLEISKSSYFLVALSSDGKYGISGSYEGKLQGNGIYYTTNSGET